MHAAKKLSTIHAVSAVAVPTVSASVIQSPAPLLIDIRAASRLLGISVFGVRVACWNPKTARALKPVRHGLKFLFSPAAIADFAAKIISGEIQFPRSPSKPRKTVKR
jgi:hypothetical protein